MLLLRILAATLAALNPAPLREPVHRRARTPLLQHYDGSSQTGPVWYQQHMHEPGGFEQGYEPGYDHGYGTQVVWQLAPAFGVFSEYFVRNGEELTLGRFDMLEQKLTVSRAQCVVQVAADGTATLYSFGKRPTGLRRACGRAREARRWLRGAHAVVGSGDARSGH